MKKLTHFLITNLMCIIITILMCTTAFAATGITISADKTAANTGDNVTVTVSAAADNCSQGGIEVNYDSKVLTMTSGDCLVSNADIKYFDAKAGDGGFAFENATTLSGPAFRFTFQVKENAAPGKSTVTVKFTTGSDSATRTFDVTVACAHKYDNACDTSCNTCGATREAKHEWDGGKVTASASCTKDGEKLYTCTACKKTKTEVITKLAHVYDNACDQACNSCGATRSTTHSYTQQSDTQNHWMKCKVCSHVKDKAQHNADTNMSTTSKTHGYKCKTCGVMVNEEKHAFANDCDTKCEKCGYTRKITHSYSQRWSQDETGHWYQCEVCKEKLEIIAHKPGPAATETEDQICTDCGFVLQKAHKHEHTMAGDWLNDDIGHWYRCACGEQATPDVHHWSEVAQKEDKLVKTCTDCGYERVEGSVPPTTDTNETAPTDNTKPVGTPVQPQKPTSKWELPWKQIALWSAGIAAVSILLNVLFVWLLRRKWYYGKYERE